ncbi:MAG: hypothetical protein HKM98_01240 [Gammaproteobacteria bacterium]|nr:hypothetical protein [Gammaproteobacteria bacterium]
MNKFVHSACRHLLRPVVSVLLRAGLPWKEFSQISREIYVDVASREYGLEGRPTNVSRVAILTGLSRKQVREQRTRLERAEKATDPGQFNMNPATRVITGWHEDPDFSTKGKANDLRRNGNKSFTELLSRYGGDIPQVALEKELKRTGAIEETGNGKLRALKRVFVPQGLDAEYIRLFGAHLHDLAHTISYNATHETPRFQRAASAENIPRAVAADFHKKVQREGQKFLERLDAWLAKHKATNSEDVTRVGVGLYFFENDDADGQRALSA